MCSEDQDYIWSHVFLLLLNFNMHLYFEHFFVEAFLIIGWAILVLATYMHSKVPENVNACWSYINPSLDFPIEILLFNFISSSLDIVHWALLCTEWFLFSVLDLALNPQHDCQYHGPSNNYINHKTVFKNSEKRKIGTTVFPLIMNKWWGEIMVLKCWMCETSRCIIRLCGEKAILLHIQANIVVHRRYLYTPRITLDDEKIACTQVYKDQKKIVQFWLQDASALSMKLCRMFRGFEQQERSNKDLIHSDGNLE